MEEEEAEEEETETVRASTESASTRKEVSDANVELLELSWMLPEGFAWILGAGPVGPRSITAG